SRVAGTTGTHHHAQLIFKHFFEMGSCHVAASQSAGIPGVSHCAWLGCAFNLHFLADSWFSFGCEFSPLD
ncbi:PREDICTED: putative uncharacterized protein FLJ38264, partial [Rhinopithecus bieti]|uniref:putative uncharacterized protein FLJ38264 n=1 Tax=Rhinopithecus bieti TaxID=61621 RepID=UPI00083C8012